MMWNNRYKIRVIKQISNELWNITLFHSWNRSIMLNSFNYSFTIVFIDFAVYTAPVTPTNSYWYWGTLEWLKKFTFSLVIRSHTGLEYIFSNKRMETNNKEQILPVSRWCVLKIISSKNVLKFLGFHFHI